VLGHDSRVTGFHGEERETLRMRIDLRCEIPKPSWPEGSSVRGFHDSDGPRLHALLEHGYRNGGGSVEAYAVWLPALTGDSEFDPALCFLVEVGDELAAAAICWTSSFVKDIVVHETWRRHGLGEALLLLAFRTLERRGAGHVELKVQAQNLAAVRLYERVGMRTVERITESS
jgi:ribosomal protein S18 acetylase RimI-like enzyme